MVGILAEKPSQARNFAKALGGMSGSYEGVSYKICAARGHLYEFAEPAKQTKAADLSKWRFDTLPWDDRSFSWIYVKKTDTQKVLSEISKTFSDCDEICIGTDDDPTGEGELLAFEILSGLHLDHGKKISRMYFEDEAVSSVRKAFINRKPIVSRESDADYRKALYRCKWDFLSMQFTRIATLCAPHHAVLRQGRLKSAMVLLVGNQQAAVDAYRPVPFYCNKFRDDQGVVYSAEEEPQFASEAEVPKKYKTSFVNPVSDTVKRTAPPQLIDLASLSAALSSKYPAKTILSTYQKMYESQVVSYPRTEDKFITPEQFQMLLPKADAIARLIGVDPCLLTHKAPRNTHVKTGCAHGANRPGDAVPKSLDELDQYGPGAKEIYILLAKSYLKMLMGDYVYRDIKGKIHDYPNFVGNVKIPVEMGWKALGSDDEDDKKNSAKALGKTAQPFVAKGVPKKPQTPSMKWLMKQLEKRNVGTGATRTSTYADVTNAKTKYPLLIDKKGKLSMSEFGRMSYLLLPGTCIGDLGVTERIYEQMNQIAKGSFDPQTGFEELSKMVLHDIDVMKKNQASLTGEFGSSDQREEKENAEGTFQGKQISFHRVWGGHRFSDEEVAALLNGEEIVFSAISSKSGKSYMAKGTLKKQTYNGHNFYGFSPQFK